jgi:hypothetical protein
LALGCIFVNAQFDSPPLLSLYCLSALHRAGDGETSYISHLYADGLEREGVENGKLPPSSNPGQDYGRNYAFFEHR